MEAAGIEVVLVDRQSAGQKSPVPSSNRSATNGGLWASFSSRMGVRNSRLPALVRLFPRKEKIASGNCAGIRVTLSK
jgi:hypothetical protein